uniref:Rieske domain-containing protein n=1 Tax=Panagrolaimus superbus TaxID=310955 RepID=A0A914YQN3_9BILA
MYRSVRQSLSSLKGLNIVGNNSIDGGGGGDEIIMNKSIIINNNNNNNFRSDSAASSVDEIHIDIDQRRSLSGTFSRAARVDSAVHGIPVQEKLCGINELQDGEMKEVTLSILSADNIETIDYRILVIKEKDDKWYALAPNCTYCNTPLIKGVICHGRIRCPLHGTAFNLKSGKLEDLPGFDSLPAFKVTLSLTDVFLSTTLTKISQTRIIDPMSKCKDSINDPVVIVGAGIAGITCAETLRHEGYNGRIVLISREDHLPYNRSLLSKNLDLLEDDVIFRKKEFYEIHDIELLLGHRVKTINVEEKILTMDDEKKITFKYLVLATGGINKPSTIKGADLDGVYSLRDISDHSVIQQCSVKKHVTIVGSGFIALEIASAIGKRARSITVLGKSGTPFKTFGPTFGRNIRSFLQDHTRITIRQDSLVRSFEGFDQVEHMVLKDGLCAVAQTVIIANGIHPCTSMLVGSGIQMNTMGYVIVDEQMKTNQTNVFAIGDCTEFPLTLFGGHRISLPHVQIAQFQGLEICFDTNLL